LFDDVLLQAARAPCTISFTDPDAVVAIDTIDDRAGIGLWAREVSFGTACCDRIDPRGYPPERRFKADPDE
jgi:hypothetical protein